jgi:CHAD domain-containing protein
MITDCLRGCYKDRYEVIEKNFVASRSTLSADAIHDMRVEIKRLRAFYRLVGHLDSSFIAKEHFRKIRKLFRAAGKVRDVQVQKELFADISQKHKIEGKDYLASLEQREQSTGKAYRKAASKFNIQLILTNYDRIEAAVVGCNATDIRHAIRTRINELLCMSSEKKDSHNLALDDLHQIRINTKEARYTLEVLLRCFECEERIRALNNLLRNVHRALGRWHDNVIGLETLSILGSELEDISFSEATEIFNANCDAHLIEFYFSYDNLLAYVSDNPEIC